MQSSEIFEIILICHVPIYWWDVFIFVVVAVAAPAAAADDDDVGFSGAGTYFRIADFIGFRLTFVITHPT